MAKLQVVQVRVSEEQGRILEKLSAKLFVSKSAAMRIAMMKLAEAEGVTPQKKTTKAANER